MVRRHDIVERCRYGMATGPWRLVTCLLRLASIGIVVQMVRGAISWVDYLALHCSIFVGQKKPLDRSLYIGAGSVGLEKLQSSIATCFLAFFPTLPPP